jgi:transcriptional regulator with XRE-family HTH domain
MIPKNITGPQIAKLREKRGMTQQQFAARCTKLGLKMSRGTLAKIEVQVKRVVDSQLVILAKALKVDLKKLYPGGKR